MRQLILIFLIMLGSVLISDYLLQDPGYILIQFHSWRLESSVVILLMTLLVLFLMLSFAIHLLHTILKLPIHFYHLLQRWQKARQERHFKQGLEAFFKGEWSLVLKKLKHPSKASSWPLDLISAQAAQNQGLIKERDRYLQLAAIEAPKERETVLMFQAQLQIKEGQYEQAQATLAHIQSHSKYLSPQWYILQIEVYLHFSHVEQAFHLLEQSSDLQAQGVIYHQLFKRTLEGLKSQNLLPDSKTLVTILKKQSPSIQDDMTILLLLEKTLSEDKSGKKYLEKKIENRLKSGKIDDGVLSLLSQMELNTKAFQQYETLVSQQKSSAAIYLALAKMKARQHLWGAALNDLNQAIKLEASKEAYTLKAEIYLSLNQNSNALEAMQLALGLN